MSKLFSTFIILVALSSFSFSQQTQPCGTSKDVRIVKNKPTVYLSFERFGKATNPLDAKLFEPTTKLKSKEKGDDVWLRLHNNSCWEISFVTDSLYVSKVKSENGSNKPKILFGVLDDDIEVNIKYSVLDDDGKQVPVGTDTGSISGLPSGRSILFCVHRAHLSKGRSIHVNFNYEWEVDRYSNNLAPVHRSEYYSYRLEDEEAR